MPNENSNDPPANAPSALHMDAIRFSIHSQVVNLLNDLFVEDWSIVKNYRSYYNRCQPIQCSYTYYQQIDSLHTITHFLSLYGGLAILFKWVCPRIVYLTLRISRCCRKRSASVQPRLNLDVAVIDVDNTIDS